MESEGKKPIIILIIITTAFYLIAFFKSRTNENGYSQMYSKF
jgi:hypothetical protein